MKKYLWLCVLIVLSAPAMAAKWKLSYEQSISNTRKVCVYEDKAGNTKQVEQSKSQYCRTYL